MADRQPFELNLHIGELVLHGFEHLDRAELGTAVRQSLVRLFGENGLPASIEHAARMDRIDGGTLDLPANAGVSVIGERIARSIHRSFQS